MAKASKRFNGKGTIYKLSGKRANPWIARVLKGYEFKGDKRIAKYQTIGCAPTKMEAQELLDRYLLSPYNLDAKQMTFKDVYELWSKKKYPTISEKNVIGYKASFKALQPIHNRMFRDVKYLELQDVIDNCEKNYPTLKKIKTLLVQVYDFAIRCEYCETNYGRLVEIEQYRDRNPNKYEHTSFTSEEMKILWENSHNIYVQVILMLIYCGSRITPFLNILKEDVHLDENYVLIRDMKNAQSYRNVPIANVVKPFYEFWMEYSPCEYLFCTRQGKHLKYRNYKDDYWHNIFDEMGLRRHLPHDCRHSLTSLMERAKIDITHRKRILGHKSNDITQDIYTHLTMEQLVEDINKVHDYIDVL